MLKKLSYLTVVISLMWTVNTMALELQSTAFQQGGKIPKAYTCDGPNISPPLSWKDIPSGTKSLALIMDDPDAPLMTWDHWIVYNLPPTANSLGENVQNLPEGTFIGTNSWNKPTYGGPCPPDREHRYFFKLYALDIMLPTAGMTKQEVEKAINGHILASTELIAKYQRVK